MRAISLVPAILVAGLLAACNPSEQDFPDAYGSTVCSKLKKCDRADYDRSYDSKDECVADWADAADFLLDLGGILGADYSDKLAGDCLSEIRHASCEAFDDGEYECDVFE